MQTNGQLERPSGVAFLSQHAGRERAQRFVRRYRQPGNIRQLRQIYLADGDEHALATLAMIVRARIGRGRLMRFVGIRMIVMSVRMTMGQFMRRVILRLVRMLASMIVVGVRMMQATTHPHMQGKGERGSETDDRAHDS